VVNILYKMFKMNLLKDANKYFSDQYSKYVDLCVI